MTDESCEEDGDVFSLTEIVVSSEEAVNTFSYDNESQRSDNNLLFDTRLV